MSWPSWVRAQLLVSSYRSAQPLPLCEPPVLSRLTRETIGDDKRTVRETLALIFHGKTFEATNTLTADLKARLVSALPEIDTWIDKVSEACRDGDISGENDRNIDNKKMKKGFKFAQEWNDATWAVAGKDKSHNHVTSDITSLLTALSDDDWALAEPVIKDWLREHLPSSDDTHRRIETAQISGETSFVPSQVPFHIPSLPSFDLRFYNEEDHEKVRAIYTEGKRLDDEHEALISSWKWARMDNGDQNERAVKHSTDMKSLRERLDVLAREHGHAGKPVEYYSVPEGEWEDEDDENAEDLVDFVVGEVK